MLVTPGYMIFITIRTILTDAVQSTTCLCRHTSDQLSGWVHSSVRAVNRSGTHARVPPMLRAHAEVCSCRGRMPGSNEVFGMLISGLGHSWMYLRIIVVIGWWCRY